MPSSPQQIKDFGKSPIHLELPYLLAVQQESWSVFWQRHLKELLFEISPIRDYTKKEFELWFLDYKLGKANYPTEVEAKKNDDSFEIPLRVRVRLVNLKTKEVKEQEVFLCDFPLMTERGTFVLNGVERVAIAQLIRSPGVFFTAQLAHGKNQFGAKIIPNRGAWLEFETESSGFIGVRIDRKRKAAATTLLRAFGVETDEEIKKLFADVDTGSAASGGLKYIEETLKKDASKNQGEALVEIYRRLRPGDYVTADTAKELIWNMFFNFERYDLSRVGRWKTLQRLPSLQKSKVDDEIAVEDRVLKLEDVVEALREVIRLNNTSGAEPDQIDHLGNRRVRTFVEFLQNRMRVGFMRMERIVKDRMSTLDPSTITPAQLINPRPVMAVVKEFFTSSQITQFMDNENPLAELEHKRRISATGPGGLTRERAGFEVRDVQPSHYGRICPIQTPEGPNIGLVGHLASYAKINEYGFLETPYFKVEKGKITKELRYLTAYEEEQHSIAPAGVPIDKEGRIIPEKVEARVKGEPGMVDRDKVDFIDVSPQQFISVATALIPFLRNDDANRALMGSNMQRQAVPLIKPQAPLVGTGYEVRVAKDSGLAVVAQEDGLVQEVDARHIRVKSKGSAGKQNSKTEFHDYQLKNFARTNQYTCFHQKPIVEKGDAVKAGQIIADGGAIDHGRLALGANLLVAFMPWRGGNYEDAVILSERVVRDDVYTSIHLEDFTCDVRETKLGPEVTTSDIPNVGEEKLKDLDEEGIVRVGAQVGPNDILVGKISPKGEADLTAEERLLRAIFGEKARDVKDTSLLMPHGKRGRVVNVKVFSREEGHRLEPGVMKRIHVEVAELRKVQRGDKLAGRHGNKGVISLVLPEADMPHMEDGTPVDIILNPLGVASRMNIGQILETHLGWAAHELGYLAVTPGLSGANEEDIRAELERAGLPLDGKVTLYDGRDGTPFVHKITVGYVYMMKLIHMVEDKIHMRSIGPYSLITQQPLGGKAQFGGQRFGEMEVWALEGYGAAHTLQEMLTIKSDDVPGRAATYESILRGQPIQTPNLPASFNLLLNELRSLALHIEVKGKIQKEDEKR
ncbi:MAG: DNA-directed RNA polymerase subunit beta [Candidatus Wildermuthbacteria bacterium RIFCSPLOWO2_01_FULL_48_29]|uniref:DNA-directed RNA polymerase subunit beta n=1 Tax=Candidatus Wildermuthbacteria bacterium RIFCSPLOWO2_01_FULL_48_29 TaxID=1802462 RepID=A0A1G2RNN5_9BACT|nr:MAG: DNA-directed RNA polymerase subunit beta [Candidatus Wildermuthbacteria bacterium RIFCSPLOWO2_01_FULL_48_29]